MCTRPCMCPPRVEFLFPPVLWNSCDQTLPAFHAKYSKGLLFPVPEPQPGEPDVEHGSLTPLGGPL